ncbi:amidohydrolase family protein [Propionispora hippei]|uniref:Amidohydrolase-related domain-containing protein n=1 Tax=Propionispora hippei DSM 15287 TaxID=1123003 RepID=A0A1M6DS45_9FIRM|nr:amidohydrolase family protein [Propionispora hippei]SHI76031.1 hypothetical protein SAMN02745170_00982 [Propionispora hippei DSM 15287]
MKIIGLEEHLIDPGIAKASMSAQEKTAPYFKESLVPNLTAFPAPGSLEDISEKRLADMDANGIAMQVLSISSAAQLITGTEAIPLTVQANNRLAAAVKAHPDRFAAFAALPMAHSEAAATELERVVKELGFKGAMLPGRPEAGTAFLDDERYAPVLAMAAKLNTPIYLHPGFPIRPVQQVYYEGFDPIVSARLSVFGWGWHAEAGIHLLRLILSGAFDKYPDLQLITGHWGEMVPFFLSRLDDSLPKAITHLQKTISEYFTEHVYVTPSGMFGIPHLLFTMQTVGVDRILFSVDYPYIGNEGARNFLENAPIAQADKEKIAHLNAEKLLKL